jgi:transcriptional regulator with XRE-family HTH domain
MKRVESRFSSPAVQLRARHLGEAVRSARIARATTLEAMAERARMSPVTWMRIERGEVSVSMGSWLSAFEQTGLLEHLDPVSDPRQDRLGEQLRRVQRRQRVRSPQASGEDFDF